MSLPQLAFQRLAKDFPKGLIKLVLSGRATRNRSNNKNVCIFNHVCGSYRFLNRLHIVMYDFQVAIYDVIGFIYDPTVASAYVCKYVYASILKP